MPLLLPYCTPSLQQPKLPTPTLVQTKRCRWTHWYLVDRCANKHTPECTNVSSLLPPSPFPSLSSLPLPSILNYILVSVNSNVLQV